MRPESLPFGLTLRQRITTCAAKGTWWDRVVGRNNNGDQPSFTGYAMDDGIEFKGDRSALTLIENVAPKSPQRIFSGAVSLLDKMFAWVSTSTEPSGPPLTVSLSYTDSY